MEFEMTPQREAYFNARGKTILNACPGSGKTTSIIHKLAILEKECNEKHGNHAGIACLSFTNVAKNEILHKYKEVYKRDLLYPNLVSTIDSFINQYITLPFYNLLHKDFERPRIVDDAKIIDNLVIQPYKDKKGVWQEGFIYAFLNFKNKEGVSIFRSYSASSFWIDVNGDYTLKGKNINPDLVDPQVFKDCGNTLFSLKIKEGLITSLDSAYIALDLLKTHPNIGKWLANKFPYLIIDEAQDNSEIQHAIFDKLIDLGLSNIEMIGDPYQSLYEWRNAKPQLFVQKYADTSWNGLPLSQNRRSVQRIIDCFSKLRTPTDEIITTHGIVDLNIPILVYKYNETNPSAIVADFETRCIQKKFKDNHIVVRGHTLKNKMLGNISEVEPWKHSAPYLLLQIKHHFEVNEIKIAVNELRKLVLKFQNPSLDYKKLHDLINEVSDDYIANGKLYKCLFEIPSTSLSFLEWSNESINLLNTSFKVDIKDAFEFKSKINGFVMKNLKNESISKYFNKPASNNNNIPITTIHQIKGATLDAILYFFDEDSKGQSVSFNDFKQSTTFPTEKQRMIYVACSRPKQLLALAFPDKLSDAEIKSKFGSDIEIVVL